MLDRVKAIPYFENLTPAYLKNMRNRFLNGHRQLGIDRPICFLSAFAEDHGCKPMDECARGTLRSSESEGGCFGGLRRRNEGYHGRKPVEASLWSNPTRALLASSLFLLLLFASSSLFPAPGQMLDDTLAQARRSMVEKDLRGQGIKDPRVLEAMATVPRHLFVPESQRFQAYRDRALPIGEGQTISQPYVVALMTELLEIKATEKVLEVGTGSGYQAAVLSHLAREVYTIEIIPSLAERARKTLARLRYNNVLVKTGDGFFGWEEKGPFDAILVTASAKKVPEPLWNQLREEGRLVMPLGDINKAQRLIRIRNTEGKRRVEDITGVIFVPMTGTARERFP